MGLAVTAADPESGDALAYSVAESSGPDAAADPAADLADFNRDFSLDAATGQVSVGAGAAIDFETRSAYKVAYRVTDNKNAAGGNDPAIDDTLVLTVDVTDANEAPVFAAGSASRTVAENTATGDVGLAVTAADPDSGDVLAYSVAVTSEAGAAADLADFNRDFSLDAATGQVSVKATAAIDFETRSSYKVAYRVTDNKNAAGGNDPAIDDTLILTVDVTDANEAPRFADSNSDGTADAVTRTVTENTASGGVGLAVTAADPESGDVLAYSVAESSGPDAAADPAADLADFNRDFSLDAATGQVSVKATAVIDFEARSAYVVAYRVTDNKNAAGGNDPAIDDTLVLTISVGNENEAGSVSVSGDPEAGATLTASVSDPDGAVSGVGWVWSVGASVSGSFSAVSGATDAGFVVRAADVGMYLRAAATYTDVTHTAAGQTAAETVGPVGAANSAPRFADSNSDGTADAVSRTIAENTATGDVGLAVTATDDDSDALTYSVAESSGPDAAADPAADLADFNRDFSLDAATGQVSVGAGAVIDFEARSAYVVAYRVTDNKNAAGGNDPAIDDTLVLTISVGNLNEAGSVSVSGDPDAGATLTASVSDPDGAVSGVGWVWSVGASVSGSFSAVSGATDAGFVVRAADVGMYLRAAATYTDVTHTAAGQTAAETVGPVGAANSAPRFADSNSDGTADAVSRTIAENTATGDVGAAVTATDDDSDALTYSVAESSGPGAAADPAADLADFNRDFSLDAATGQVSVGAGAAIDFEARSSYKVAYRVTDNKNAAGGNDPAIDDTLVLTVDVTDANEAPVFADSNSDGTADAVTRTVTENTTTGNVGLAVTAADPDSGDVLAYSVAVTSDVGAADHLADFNRDFSLDAATGQVSVKATAAIDYETRSSYKVAYRVTDNKNSAGSVDTAVDDTLVLTINVTDVAETTNSAPGFASSSASRAVAENTASGNVGLAVTATDADSDALTYSVAESSGPDAATDPAADLADFNRDFSLDAATGQVSVGAGAVIDFETRSAYKVAYRVTDNKNAAGGNDPAIDDTIMLTINVGNENEAGVVVVSGGLVPGVTLTASVSDPDGAVSGVSWQWARGDAERGPFVDVAGASDVSFVLSPADSGKFVRATASYVDVAHSVPGQMAAETVGPVAAAGVVVAPSVPRGVRVASGLGAVTVSWEASQSNGGALLRFEYRSAKGSTIGHDVPWVDAGDALEVVVRGLETGAVSGELYTLEVRARNEAGYSDTVTVRVRPLPRQYWRWVSFGQYQHSAEEGGDTATVRVRLQTRTNDRVEVPVVVSYHGGATSDDVHEVVRSVVFEPGERERTLRVRAVDDRDDDDGEWVGLGFGDLPAGLHAGGPNGSARVSIVDSVDDVPGVSAGFVQASMSSREGQRVTPTLTLTGEPEVPQTRRGFWQVRLELSWTSSTAHGPGRFGGQASSWVQFDARHMSRTINVLCPDDQVRGPAHSITVEIDSAWLEGVPERLAAPIPLELASGNRRLVVDCAEDDTAAPPTTPSYPTVAAAISTTAQPAVMREAGETSATLAVTLSADPGRDVWIPLRVTADGADSSDFDFGDPYENGVLRYAPFRPSGGVHRFGDDHAFPYVLFRAGGPLTQTFRVWAQDDRHHDPGEAIDIALGNLPERITGTGSVRVSISDDDPAPAVTVSLRTYDSPPSEDAGPARVCVRLDKNPQRRLVIALEVTRNGGATPADHSAVPAEVVFEDYQHDPFPHSPRCANIELWALDDTERDPDESITITITATPPDVTIDPTRRSITIELRDNDTD